MQVQMDPVSPKAMLEKTFIEAYLRNKGHTLESLNELPEDENLRLRKEASIYASCRMAEVDARAGFVQETHGVASQTAWFD